ncbi:MAG: hypothetical protein J6Y24_02045 [Bacteroidales bacterium]|nr:hypothetical protein [Bacteroidales bacterium]
MMQLVDRNGKVILERERPHINKATMSSVKAKKMSYGLKKTVRPVLMSKEEFLKTIVQDTHNGNI